VTRANSALHQSMKKTLIEREFESILGSCKELGCQAAS